MDYKNQVMNELTMSCADILTDEQHQKLQDIIIKVLHGYDITIKDAEKELPIAIDEFNEELLKRFLISKTIRGLSKNTLVQYKLRIRNLLYTINKRLDDVSADDIRYYLVNYKYSNQISNSTMESMRLYFSSFFGWLYKEELIRTNPMSKIESIKYEYHKESPFSASDIEALIDNCNNIRDRAIMEFLLSTGCRVSEMCSLNINDIDYYNKQIEIVGKGNKQRTVYLSDKALYYLKKYIESRDDDDDIPLFISNRKRRMRKDTVEAIFRRLGKKAGVPNCHPHRFRRTFCCTLIDRGMPIQDVKELMGHSKIDTTLIYYNNTSKKIKSEYDNLI